MRFKFANNSVILPLIILNLIITSMYITYTFHNNQKPINEIPDKIVIFDLMNNSEFNLTDLANSDNFNDILESIKVPFGGVAPPEKNPTEECNQNTFYG